MSQPLKCPQCGSNLILGDRFCGECGCDISALSLGRQQIQSPSPPPPASPPGYQALPPDKPGQRPVADPPSRGDGPGGSTANHKGALIIVIGIVLVLLAGGGLFWWLSQPGDGHQPQVTGSGGAAMEQTQTEPPAAGPSTAQSQAQVDLTRASTYLPPPGLKCVFDNHYVDGTEGPMERVNALVVPAEAVRVSEVEIITDQGETVGYGFHYIERADGIYLVYDPTPQECSPVLKNNLTVGQTWSYGDGYGQVVSTVLDMGVRLDLGFTILSNCLLVEEDNQAFGFKKIIYYAPGMGRVLEKTSEDGADLLKLTAFSKIDPAQAAEMVKRWAPNYQEINDDRTQS